MSWQRRWPFLLFLATSFPVIFPAWVIGEEKTIVKLGFDDSTLDVGDQEYVFFRDAKGSVDISSDIVFSGYRSFELREEPFDGNFMELQGPISVQREGILRFRFALLVENPGEQFNVALAGPNHFQMSPDGIAFWLASKEGMFIHYSDGIPKRLMKIEPFEWYIIDMLYDIQKGTYLLSIQSESGHQEDILLRDQANAVNSPASAVSKYSFIGDLEDSSRVHFFADDILISTFTTWEEAYLALENDRLHRPSSILSGTLSAKHETHPSLSQTQAQGSSLRVKKTYVESFITMQLEQHDAPRCLPATSLRDFGIERDKAREYLSSPAFQQALRGPGESSDIISDPVISSITQWRKGCAFLRENQEDAAEGLFRRALLLLPNNALISSSLSLSLSKQGKKEEAQDLSFMLQEVWKDDPRLMVFLATINDLKGQYPQATKLLEDLAHQLRDFPTSTILGELVAGDTSDRVIKELRREFPKNWRKRIDDVFVAQKYYFNLLWQGQFADAYRFAHSVHLAYEQHHLSSVKWIELETDAAYLQGNLTQAAEGYESLTRLVPQRKSPWLKLADVDRMLGQIEKVKKIREEFLRRFPRR